MAELTPAQRQIADAMIAGTFDSVGAKPAYMSAPTSVEEMYRGIYPPASAAPAWAKARAPAWASNGPALYQMARDLAHSPVTRYAVDGSGNRIDPYATNPAVKQATLMASGVPLPRRRPGYAPTVLDIAAMNHPVGANPGMGGAMIGNGIMSPSIPPQGPPPPGIAPTVWAGDNRGAAPIIVRPPALTPVQKLQAQGLTAAQAYAAANSGRGSVAAMEAKHSGRPAGAYSDGREPSGTGSLW